MPRITLVMTAAIAAAVFALAAHAQVQPKGSDNLKAPAKETKAPAYLKIDSVPGDSVDPPKPPPPPPPSQKK